MSSSALSLIVAAAKGDVGLVRILHEHGVVGPWIDAESIEDIVDPGSLIVAAAKGDVGVVRMLHEAGLPLWRHMRRDRWWIERHAADAVRGGFFPGDTPHPHRPGCGGADLEAPAVRTNARRSHPGRCAASVGGEAAADSFRAALLSAAARLKKRPARCRKETPVGRHGSCGAGCQQTK